MNRRTFLTATAAVLALPFIGQRDDATYLQSHINAVRASGRKTVHVPAGHYVLSKPIRLPAGTRLVGAPGYKSEFSPGAVFKIDGPGCEISGMMFWNS